MTWATPRTIIKLQTPRVILAIIFKARKKPKRWASQIFSVRPPSRALAGRILKAKKAVFKRKAVFQPAKKDTAAAKRLAPGPERQRMYF